MTRRCQPLHYALIAIAMVALLQGCAARETRWTHPDLPSDQWSVDAAQCKWEARRKAEKEFNEDSAIIIDSTFQDEQSFDTMMAGVDVKKRSRELFTRCMRSLGYVAAK